jgi:hypothetical protein
MLADRVQPVLPHINSFIDYIYHSIDGTGTLSLDSSSLGATDLITRGDWTVPREGSSSVLSNNDVSANSESGLGGLLFQSPFSSALFFCSGPSLLGTSGV